MSSKAIIQSTAQLGHSHLGPTDLCIVQGIMYCIVCIVFHDSLLLNIVSRHIRSIMKQHKTENASIKTNSNQYLRLESNYNRQKD